MPLGHRSRPQCPRPPGPRQGCFAVRSLCFRVPSWACGSVHHSGITVVFEFQQVIGRIYHKKGAVFFRKTFESDERLAKKLYLSLHCGRQHALKERRIREGNTEMARVHFRDFIDLVRAQMTDDLMAQKFQCDPIVITARDPASQSGIKIGGFIQVCRGNRQMENDILVFRHRTTSFNTCVWPMGFSNNSRVSDLSPRRSVSRLITSSSAMLARFTLGPSLRMK